MKTLLDPYLFVRPGADSLVLGRCPLCGRWVTRWQASRFGSRCKYEGARFNLNGEMIYDGKKDVQTTPGAPHVEESVRIRLIEYDRLLTFAEVAGGVLRWAEDHGAEKAFITSLKKMRQSILRTATKKGGESPC